MSTVKSYITSPFYLQTFPRWLVSTFVLLSLTACTGGLDDPHGVKQRRAEERKAECQQIYSLKAKDMENSLQTADTLEALDLEDRNLQVLSLELATHLRLLDEAERTVASFADVEQYIASANKRSSVHQASVVERNRIWEDYAGVSYTLELYCKGEKDY